MATMKIPLTFKDDEKWLYDLICTHSSRGGYIKDVLKESLKDYNPNFRPIQPMLQNTTSNSNNELSLFKGLGELLK